MKKFIFAFCMVLFVFALPVFAAPSEQEVADTLGEVMGVYAITMMQVMFGGGDETLSLKQDTENGAMITTYKNYYAKEAIKGLNTMADEKDDKIPTPFDYMTGTITVKGDFMGGDEQPVDMLIDVSLKGGNIRTIWVKVKEDPKDPDNPYIQLKVNGKVYNNSKGVWEKSRN